MIVLDPIPVSELLPYIELAFLGDDDLLNKYAIVNGSLEDVAKHVYGIIKEVAKQSKDYRVYKVRQTSEGYSTDIGYTTMLIDEVNMLHSFGIIKILRNKKYLVEWLAEVRKILNKGYFVSLYRKNERAINFFLKNNFIVDEEMTKIINIIDSKTIALCQQEEQ